MIQHNTLVKIDTGMFLKLCYNLKSIKITKYYNNCIAVILTFYADIMHINTNGYLNNWNCKIYLKSIICSSSMHGILEAIIYTSIHNVMLNASWQIIFEKKPS